MQLLICLLQRLRSLPEALRIFLSTEWASVYLALCQQTLRFIQPQEEFSVSPWKRVTSLILKALDSVPRWTVLGTTTAFQKSGVQTCP